MSKTAAEKSHDLVELAPGVWTMSYPLTVLGADEGRVVTILGLSTGKLIIHSTAPFSVEEAEKIRSLGEPGWILDANLHHDSYVREGTQAFPGVPYLAPPDFPHDSGVSPLPILSAAAEWQGEVEVLVVEGAPSFNEHVFFHRKGRTLIVSDLVFNFVEEETTWEWLLRHYAMGLKGHPAVNRLFSAAVKDEHALESSLRRILEWDFDRIVVGHKQPVEEDAKLRFKQAMERAFPKLQL